MKDEAVVEETRCPFGQRGDEAGYHDLAHVLLDARVHPLVGVELVVLGAEHYGVDALGAVDGGELHRELRLRVGAQVGHELRFVVPYAGEDLEQPVREREGEGHVLVAVDARIAEHHSLVAGALFHGVAAHHSAVDVGALLVYGGDDSAGGGVEAVFGLGVADAAYHAARSGRNVHVGVFRAHLSAHYHEAGGAESLAGHLRFGVLAEEFVENCV